MLTQHITVAQAAAILNVAIVLVQITYPLLITLVAVGIVKRRTNVATWSVFGRLINHSHWPVILQTDTVNGKKVDKRVRGLAIGSALTTFLLAIAAIVTPLGLHSTIRGTEVNDVRFEYVRDTSAVGRATQSRDGYQADRTCDDTVFTVPCPGNDDGLETFVNASGSGLRTLPGRDDAYLTTTIPQNTTEVFMSADGDNGGTVANLFDIEYRSFVNYNNQTDPGIADRINWIDAGKPRTQGKFQYYQQFLLENKTRAIEGLIISTQENPGIGFRNHTLPPSSEYGYSWSEKILWMEPQTQCTNLNLTYEYVIPPPGGQEVALNETIVDRGGFANLPPSLVILDLNNTQDDPKYLDRSYAAAVATNIFLGRYMNLTRRTIRLGARYNIRDYQDEAAFSGSGDKAQPNKISFTSFGKYNYATNASDPNLPGPLSFLGTYNFTGNYDPLTIKIPTLINGYADDDAIDIKRIGFGGGLMLGIGTQLDANGNAVPFSDASQLTPGLTWSQPLFSCVSGISASIKTVDFQLNGTASLDNLRVEDIRSVGYTSEDDMPLWALETTHRNISQVTPYWGIISPEAAKTANVSTLRRREFRLPAGRTSLVGGATIIDDAIAGAKAPHAALFDIFSLGDYADYIPGAQDYTGANNYLLYLQWQRLLSNPAKVGRVVDLIWTDLMANNLVGRRSTLSEASAQASSDARRRAKRNDASTASTPSALRPAQQYSIGISYNWIYALPALLFACIYATLLLWSVTMFLTRHLSFAMLRFMLNQTAAGRSITTERSQAHGEIDVALTSVWARIRGGQMVRVGKDDLGRDGNTGGHDVGFGANSAHQEYRPLESKGGVQHSAEMASQ